MQILQFNVWDYVLTNEEVKRISSGCGYVGNVIPWYTLSHSVFGKVSVSQDVDKCKGKVKLLFWVKIQGVPKSLKQASLFHLLEISQQRLLQKLFEIG